jgi:hypothetical protein
MANLKITMACWNYDRTRGLMDGTVKPEGVDLTYKTAFVAEIFERMVRDKEFEVSELGLTFYLRSLELENPPFIAIPVFPLRFFRHAAVFVNTESGITSPKDLVGKKVGELLCYGHDSGVWSKGIFKDDYGVPTAIPIMSAISTNIRFPNGIGCRSPHRPACGSISFARIRISARCWKRAKSMRSIRRSCRRRISKDRRR